MLRECQLTGLTNRRCLEIWSRLEDRSDFRRHFMTDTRRLIHFNRLHEFLDTIHGDLKLPVP